MASLLAEAARIAGSDGRVEDRVVAIRLLGLADAKTARALFPKLLDARQPSAVQLAVLQALAGCFDRDLAREIIGHWKSMSPAVRREAVEVLFGRREGIEAVVGALESRALQPSELDPARLKQLQAHSDPSLRARAQKILAADASAARDRNQVIASYRPAIQLAGDRDKGRDVFSKVCATCHQAEGRGVDVGPEPGDSREPLSGGPSHPHPRPEPRGRAQLRELQRGDCETAASFRESSPRNRPMRFRSSVRKGRRT